MRRMGAQHVRQIVQVRIPTRIPYSACVQFHFHFFLYVSCPGLLVVPFILSGSRAVHQSSMSTMPTLHAIPGVYLAPLNGP